MNTQRKLSFHLLLFVIILTIIFSLPDDVHWVVYLILGIMSATIQDPLLDLLKSKYYWVGLFLVEQGLLILPVEKLDGEDIVEQRALIGLQDDEWMTLIHILYFVIPIEKQIQYE